MKSLIRYIEEGLSNKQIELVSQLFSSMFVGTKLSKDQIKSILINLDKDVIQSISDNFSKNESESYLAYAPNDDEFLDFDNSKEKIINQLSEYINKYKSN